MNKYRYWIIPAIFFGIICVLNLVGCLMLRMDLVRITKPALMPLLCLASMTYLLPRLQTAGVGSPEAEGSGTTADGKSKTAEGSCTAADSKGVAADGNSTDVRGAGLLLAAQLIGFAGDTMLMGHGVIFLGAGMLLFMIGHIFYICLFGSLSFRGLKPWQTVLGLAVCLAATAGLAFAVGANGVLLVPMLIYGMALMMLIFSTFAGLLRFRGGTWALLLCGALLFTFSDSLIAVRHFGTLSPFWDAFGVMSTYLLAQTLLAIGSIKLILNKI